LPTAAGPEKVEKVGLSVQFFPVTSFSHPSFFSLAYSLSIRKTWPSFFYDFVLVIKEFGEGTNF
jgi:hypothetical protein